MNSKITVIIAVALIATVMIGAVYAVSVITYAPSSPTVITVNPSPSPSPQQISGTTTLTANATALINGDVATLTITLNPATTGTVVTVYDGATVIGTTPTNAQGIATLTLSGLAVGQHSITAQAPQVTVP